MTCQIAISGITGFRSAADAPPHRLEVAGTASECEKVCVRVTRQGTGATTAEVEAEVGADGQWLAVLESAAGHFQAGAFVCGDPDDKIEVVAECCAARTCRDSTVFNGLTCQSERDCPSVTDLTATVGECNPDGTRPVSVSAAVTPNQVAPVFVQWFHGGEDGAAASFAGPGSFTDSRDYPPGVHSYGVRVIHPEGCPETSASVTVGDCAPPPPPAPVCPTITFAAPDIADDCGKNGTRTVAVSATVVHSDGAAVSARLALLGPDGEPSAILDSGDDPSGSLTLQGATSLAPGSHQVAVLVDQPAGCGRAVDTLEVAPCPTRCPGVAFDPPEIGDCAEGLRQVTLRARLSPDGPGVFAARLLLWDTVAQVPLEELDSVTSDGQPAELTVSRAFAPGTYAFVVQVTEPEGCTGRSQAVTVAPCGPEEEEEDEDEEEEDGGGLLINWCAVALGVLLALLVVGALLLGIGFCLLGVVPEGTVTVVVAVITVIGAVLLALATIGLLIWLFLCGSCRVNCFLIDILIDVLLLLAALTTILAFIGMILAALGLSKLCWIGWAIDTLDIGLLLLAAYWWARVVGCRPWPRWVPDWARISLPDALRVLCRG